MPSRFSVALLFILLVTVVGCNDVPAQDSGGPLLPQQAAYDVTFYDLDVRVLPAQKRIEGEVTVRAVVKEGLDVVVLNLDRRLSVERAWRVGHAAESLPVDRRNGGNELWISLPEERRPGETVALTVAYGGEPRVAPNPPWEGGLTWGTTPNGAPWIATSCQTAGADLWWPVKDHPSDEPDSMAISIAVPDTLVAASNGVLADVDGADGTDTYHWRVSTSINTYAVSMNVAPYRRVDTTYQSVTGTSVPVSFYALPSDTASARAILPHFLEHVEYFEETLGPYPFRRDKYGIAQTPFLGMEHQTLIAYGNGFDRQGGLGYDAGFDALHFHELAHEWYGNCVTAEDWKDFWLHEGTATYLEALYAEALHGVDAYRDVIAYFRRQVANEKPIARRGPATAQEMYNRDVYYKGALVLHTLRSMIGKEGVKRVLRRFLSADSSQPPACRHVDTEEFLSVAESIAGRSLEGFADTYLYQASLPALDTSRTGRTLRVKWTNTAGSAFDVPVPISVNGRVDTISTSNGRGTMRLPSPDASVDLDPQNGVLRASP